LQGEFYRSSAYASVLLFGVYHLKEGMTPAAVVHLICSKVFNFLNDARVKIMNYPFVKNQGGASPPPRSCLHEQ